MKTSELKKVMKEYCDAYPKIREYKSIELKFGLEPNESAPRCLIIDKYYKNNYDGNVIKIYTHNDSYVISINQELLPTSKEFKKLYNAILEYIDTPIKEREDEKRWYIHLVEDSEAYLNLDTTEDRYFISTKEDYRSYQTKFTRSEIKDWAGNDSDEVIDLIINKFGEEVKE